MDGLEGAVEVLAGLHRTGSRQLSAKPVVLHSTQLPLDGQTGFEKMLDH